MKCCLTETFYETQGDPLGRVFHLRTEGLEQSKCEFTKVRDCNPVTKVVSGRKRGNGNGKPDGAAKTQSSKQGKPIAGQPRL